LRLDAGDLSLTLLASQTFHLICNPTRAQSMVSKILSRRQEQGITQRPLFLWEPVPGVCTTGDWKDCIKAMEVVGVISPNVNEAAGFLGQIVDEDQPFEQFKGSVEALAKEYTSHQIGKSGVVVFRCGKHGCLVATPSMMKWLPAYHRTGEKVVDPTGGGNAFCGGFCVGWRESKGDFVTAAMYGNIAASFVIEQFGLPLLEYTKDGERWNGDTLEQRMNIYKSLCTGINY
jgi:sugar/nucleoside kinase (ribokinase family)